MSEDLIRLSATEAVARLDLAFRWVCSLGAVERGSIYLTQYPGFGGKLLFLACTGAVFIAGAKILDCLKFERAAEDAAKLAI